MCWTNPWGKKIKQGQGLAHVQSTAMNKTVEILLLHVLLTNVGDKCIRYYVKRIAIQ